VIPVLAARLGLIRVGSVLLAPRGELSPGALSLKSRKKRLFLTWWGRLLKDMDVVWHASSDKEDAQIRAVCRWASVAVNQDQVALSREPLPTPSAHAGPPRLVFIGRVSPMKNVDLVLHALRDVSGAVEFDIYGPLEDAAYWSCCRVLIARLPAAVKVRYRGELAPGDVCRTFSAYDAFVLPTKGENFGHAIAESLSASCPVVCSDQTPWTAVLESGGGSVVRELTAQALAEDLRRILAMTPDQRVHAKLRASDAYRAWRDRVTGGNILDQVQGVLRPGRR
jgi:glycosyltransferase involved in cell wall biosynthesis